MKTFFLTLTLLISSLNTIQASNIKLTGTILNPVAKTITLNTLDDRPFAESTIKDGKFTIKTTIKEGYYFLRHGSEVVDVYLKPKDDLEVRIDGQDYQESILFLGEGASRNNYLASKRKLAKKTAGDLQDYYSGTPEDYFKRFDALQKKQQDLLMKSNTLVTFKVIEKEDMKYERLYAIHNYEYLQDFYMGKKVTLPESYKKKLEGINYDNERLFNSVPYYRYLASSKWKNDIKNSSSLEEMVTIFDQIYSKSIKNDLLLSFYYSISKEPTKAKDYFELIKVNTSSKPFIDAAEEKLLSIEKIGPGKPSPSFTFENHVGGTTALEELKGTAILIDIWATWCAPCIKQMPALKKLEKLYENKNIKFVSISVDRKDSYTKWRDFINKKQLGGIQLFADNSFQSDFIQAYGISSIPRFIIIDKSGNIVDAYASNPSTKQLQEQLDLLLE